MFIISDYQGNENQDDSEITLHFNKNSLYKTPSRVDGKWHRKISFTAGQTGCMVQFCGK